MRLVCNGVIYCENKIKYSIHLIFISDLIYLRVTESFASDAIFPLSFEAVTMSLPA